MSELLGKWLNSEVKLSQHIDNVSRQFADGVLFFELLQKLAPAERVKGTLAATVDVVKREKNLSMLRKPMTNLGITLPRGAFAEIARERPGTAARILHSFRLIADGVSLKSTGPRPQPVPARTTTIRHTEEVFRGAARDAPLRAHLRHFDDGRVAHDVHARDQARQFEADIQSEQAQKRQAERDTLRDANMFRKELDEEQRQNWRANQRRFRDAEKRELEFELTATEQRRVRQQYANQRAARSVRNETAEFAHSMRRLGLEVPDDDDVDAAAPLQGNYAIDEDVQDRAQRLESMVEEAKDAKADALMVQRIKEKRARDIRAAREREQRQRKMEVDQAEAQKTSAAAMAEQELLDAIAARVKEHQTAAASEWRAQLAKHRSREAEKNHAEALRAEQKAAFHAASLADAEKYAAIRAEDARVSGRQRAAEIAEREAKEAGARRAEAQMIAHESTTDLFSLAMDVVDEGIPVAPTTWRRLVQDFVHKTSEMDAEVVPSLETDLETLAQVVDWEHGAGMWKAAAEATPTDSAEAPFVPPPPRGVRLYRLPRLANPVLREVEETLGLIAGDWSQAEAGQSIDAEELVSVGHARPLFCVSGPRFSGKSTMTSWLVNRFNLVALSPESLARAGIAVYDHHPQSSATWDALPQDVLNANDDLLSIIAQSEERDTILSSLWLLGLKARCALEARLAPQAQLRKAQLAAVVEDMETAAAPVGKDKGKGKGKGKGKAAAPAQDSTDSDLSTTASGNERAEQAELRWTQLLQTKEVWICLARVARAAQTSSKHSGVVVDGAPPSAELAVEFELAMDGPLKALVPAEATAADVVAILSDPEFSPDMLAGAGAGGKGKDKGKGKAKGKGKNDKAPAPEADSSPPKPISSCFNLVVRLQCPFSTVLARRADSTRFDTWTGLHVDAHLAAALEQHGIEGVPAGAETKREATPPEEEEETGLAPGGEYDAGRDHPPLEGRAPRFVRPSTAKFPAECEVAEQVRTSLLRRLQPRCTKVLSGDAAGEAGQELVEKFASIARVVLAQDDLERQTRYSDAANVVEALLVSGGSTEDEDGTTPGADTWWTKCSCTTTVPTVATVEIEVETESILERVAKRVSDGVTADDAADALLDIVMPNPETWLGPLFVMAPLDGNDVWLEVEKRVASWTAQEHSDGADTSQPASDSDDGDTPSEEKAEVVEADAASNTSTVDQPVEPLPQLHLKDLLSPDPATFSGVPPTITSVLEGARQRARRVQSRLSASAQDSARQARIESRQRRAKAAASAWKESSEDEHKCIPSALHALADSCQVRRREAPLAESPAVQSTLHLARRMMSARSELSAVRARTLSRLAEARGKSCSGVDDTRLKCLQALKDGRVTATAPPLVAFEEKCVAMFARLARKDAPQDETETELAGDWEECREAMWETAEDAAEDARRILEQVTNGDWGVLCIEACDEALSELTLGELRFFSEARRVADTFLTTVDPPESLLVQCETEADGPSADGSLEATDSDVPLATSPGAGTSDSTSRRRAPEDVTPVMWGAFTRSLATLAGAAAETSTRRHNITSSWRQQIEQERMEAAQAKTAAARESAIAKRDARINELEQELEGLTGKGGKKKGKAKAGDDAPSREDEIATELADLRGTEINVPETAWTPVITTKKQDWRALWSCLDGSGAAAEAVLWELASASKILAHAAEAENTALRDHVEAWVGAFLRMQAATLDALEGVVLQAVRGHHTVPRQGYFATALRGSPLPVGGALAAARRGHTRPETAMSGITDVSASVSNQSNHAAIRGNASVVCRSPLRDAPRSWPVDPSAAWVSSEDFKPTPEQLLRLSRAFAHAASAHGALATARSHVERSATLGDGDDGMTGLVPSASLLPVRTAADALSQFVSTAVHADDTPLGWRALHRDDFARVLDNTDRLRNGLVDWRLIMHTLLVNAVGRAPTQAEVERTFRECFSQDVAGNGQLDISSFRAVPLWFEGIDGVDATVVRAVYWDAWRDPSTGLLPYVELVLHMASARRDGTGLFRLFGFARALSLAAILPPHLRTDVSAAAQKHAAAPTRQGIPEDAPPASAAAAARAFVDMASRDASHAHADPLPLPPASEAAQRGQVLAWLGARGLSRPPPECLRVAEDASVPAWSQPPRVKEEEEEKEEKAEEGTADTAAAQSSGADRGRLSAPEDAETDESAIASLLSTSESDSTGVAAAAAVALRGAVRVPGRLLDAHGVGPGACLPALAPPGPGPAYAEEAAAAERAAEEARARSGPYVRAAEPTILGNETLGTWRHPPEIGSVNVDAIAPPRQWSRSRPLQRQSSNPAPPLLTGSIVSSDPSERARALAAAVADVRRRTRCGTRIATVPLGSVAASRRVGAPAARRAVSAEVSRGNGRATGVVASLFGGSRDGRTILEVLELPYLTYGAARDESERQSSEAAAADDKAVRQDATASRQGLADVRAAGEGLEVAEDLFKGASFVLPDLVSSLAKRGAGTDLSVVQRSLSVARRGK